MILILGILLLMIASFFFGRRVGRQLTGIELQIRSEDLEKIRPEMANFVYMLGTNIHDGQLYVINELATLSDKFGNKLLRHYDQ